MRENACTSIEQSYRLVGLGIDQNTADCEWWVHKDGKYSNWFKSPGRKFPENGFVPAWTLEALLNLFPKDDTVTINLRYLSSTFDGKGNHLKNVWCCTYDNLQVCKDFYGETALDAAYETMDWLLENKYYIGIDIGDPKGDWTCKTIWIARDDAKVPEDVQHFVERHPEKITEYGKLHIFYEKPLGRNSKGEWVGARDMVENAKDYMFPEIKCGECKPFTSVLMLINV